MSCAVVIKPCKHAGRKRRRKPAAAPVAAWQFIDSCEPEMSLSVFLGYLKVEQGCRWNNIKEKMQLCTGSMGGEGLS
ncbi:hypothetical protein NQZ68_012223 [Dissostichus eleginoides]|nr:hypothetical protein NQZ68_012223 [Dissostichus eleginoides]